jgi:hypothetical protein
MEIKAGPVLMSSLHLYYGGPEPGFEFLPSPAGFARRYAP